MTDFNAALKRMTETKKANGVSKPKLTRTSPRTSTPVHEPEEDLPATQPVVLDDEESPQTASTTSSFKAPRKKANLLADEQLDEEPIPPHDYETATNLIFTCTSCERSHEVAWPAHLYAPRVECNCTCHPTALTCIATLSTTTSGGRKRKAGY